MCARKGEHTGDGLSDSAVPGRCLKPGDSSGTLTGAPIGFPEGSRTQTARCPWFRSTAITGPERRCSMSGRGSPSENDTRRRDTSGACPGRRRRRSARRRSRPVPPPPHRGRRRRPGTRAGIGHRDDWRGARGPSGRRSSSQCSSGCPADRQVAEELTGLAVGADEEALGLPPLPPGGFAEAGSIEIVTGLRETGSPRQIETRPSSRRRSTPASLVGGAGGAGASRKTPACLKAAALADGDREPPLDPVDTGGECPSLGDKVAPGELPGVLARASDRSGPARRARGGDRPLALSRDCARCLAESLCSRSVERGPRGERAEMTAHDP